MCAICTLRKVRTNFCWYVNGYMGYAVAQFVEELGYKPEGRGSIPDGVTGIFGRIVALGSTQPLTEMSTRNPSWG